MIEKRKLRYLLTVVVLLLALIPCTALADDYEGGGGGSHNIGGSYPNFGTVWYGPKATANNNYTRYGVVAYTHYDAAMYNLFGSEFDFSSLSASKKTRLLGGSDFYSFANEFHTGKPDLDPDNILFNDDIGIISAWDKAQQLYGEEYCYSAMYDQEDQDKAKAFARSVLLSDDSESTPGEGNSDSYVYVNVNTDNIEEPGPYAGLAVNILYYNGMIEYLNAHSDYHLWIAIGKFVGNGQPDYYTISLTDVKPYWVPDPKTGYWSQYSWGASSHNVGLYQYHASSIEYNGKTYLKMDPSLQFKTNVQSWSGVTDACRPVYGYYWSEDDELPGLPPVEPPTVWPDPPEKPVGGGPEVPNPGDPIVPTPPNPWNPIPGIDIDITGDDFQDLLDALDEHCKHIQQSIQDNVSQLWSLQSDFLSNQFDDLFDAFADLQDYLHQLFEWLADQMEFNVNVEGNQYDDTSVIYWLKQIWSSLPSGINTRPTDPVVNPTGWWDWLTQLLNNLAADLMALGHDKLAGVLEMLNQLRNKFPFSLPWDIAALLGLLVAVPECPEFDVPAYALGSNMELAEVGSYHITLEPYEDVWEGVKWIETLAFAVYLITHTGGLMDMVTKTVRPR